MTQSDQTNTRPGVIGALDLFAVEHLRNIILDRDEEGRIQLAPTQCPLCHALVKWAEGEL